MNESEAAVLARLDRAVRSDGTAHQLDAIVARVIRKLGAAPEEPLAWEPVPLEAYERLLPASIRSSWVFVLRADTVTGAERHPNSHQRMMSYRGAGDFQTRTDGDWVSHHLTSDRSAPLADRWISIPPNVWHQGVVPGGDWAVVSFHTVTVHELIEERPPDKPGAELRRRHYAADGGQPGRAAR